MDSSPVHHWADTYRQPFNLTFTPRANPKAHGENMNTDLIDVNLRPSWCECTVLTTVPTALPAALPSQCFHPYLEPVAPAVL